MKHNIHIDGMSERVMTDVGMSIMGGLVMSGRKAMRKVINGVIIITVLCTALPWLMFKTGLTADDSDGASRSGLVTYTDATTGCQYLSAGGSGITPRMDKDGYQVCAEKRNDQP